MTRSRLLIAFCFCVALGWVITWASRSMLDRVLSMDDVLYNQCALLAGEPFRFGDEVLWISPHYNRVLFPLLFCNLQQWTVLDSYQWYYSLRWLFVSGSFGVVWAVVYALSKSQERATTICIFLALLLVVTFNHNVEHPHDVLDMATFALGMYFTVRGRWRSLLVLAIACAVHRESAAFMGILWWGYHYRSRFALLEGIIVAIANYALVLAVRLVVAGPAALQGTQWLSLVDPLPFFQKFFVDNEIFLALAAIVVIATWLSLGTHGIPRRLVTVAVGIAGVSLIFGLFYELRIFIPSITILAIGSVVGVAPVAAFTNTPAAVTDPV